MNYKKIHFVGIKGVGMASLAIICKEAGVVVSGSDVDEEFITDLPLKASRITVFKNFATQNVDGVDLVILSGSHGGHDNIEVVSAKSKNIKVMPLSVALGKLMSGGLLNSQQLGIAVAGTHGKTTTTGLIATMLMHSKMDPSYFIGTSSIPSLKTPGHFGKGKYVVVEADEYVNDSTTDRSAKFLEFHPQIAVITNIEFDHVDIYSSLDEVSNVFKRFVNNLSPTGVLVAYGDDPEVKKIIKDTDKRVITYGFSPSNDYFIKRVNISSGFTFFHVEGQGADLGEFSLQIMGEHNALNALAAVIVGLEVGLSISEIKNTLKLFQGSKRRFEELGVLPDGAVLYDDYAHHPTEIKKTLATFKKVYPRKKIVAIFQPHTYSRTKILFDDFTKSFTDADEIIISDIYGSKREDVDTTISSELLAQKLSLQNSGVVLQKSLNSVVEYVKNRRYNDDFVLVTLGAGDIYQIAPFLLSNDK